MSATPSPTIEEIRSILADMARCVAADQDPTLDPVIRAGIRRAVDELERFIPGLDPTPDPERARLARLTRAVRHWPGALVLSHRHHRGHPRRAARHLPSLRRLGRALPGTAERQRRRGARRRRPPALGLRLRPPPRAGPRARRA